MNKLLLKRLMLSTMGGDDLKAPGSKKANVLFY